MGAVCRQDHIIIRAVGRCALSNTQLILISVVSVQQPHFRLFPNIYPKISGHIIAIALDIPMRVFVAVILFRNSDSNLSEVASYPSHICFCLISFRLVGRASSFAF